MKVDVSGSHLQSQAAVPLSMEVLQLCSLAVIGWLDAPSGLFGLRSIQMASI
jgi:hypothetical protein